MRDNSLQTKYTTGRITLPVVYAICTIGWFIALLYTPATNYPYSTNNPIWNMVPFEYLPNWLSQLTSFGILTLVGYLLIQLNNQFTIITQRATVQTTLFVLFITAIPQTHILQPTAVATSCFLVSTFFLFHSYKEYNSMVQLFFASLALAITFMMIPKFVVLMPLIIISRITFNSFNLKTICASLLGLALPIWFLFAHAIWHNEMHLFYYPFQNLADWTGIFDYSNIAWNKFAIWGFASFITLLAIFHQLITRSRMRTRTRQMLNHFSRMAVAIMLFTAIYPPILISMIPMWFLCISFTYGYSLVTHKNRVSNYLFITVLTLLISLFAYNIWTL